MTVWTTAVAPSTVRESPIARSPARDRLIELCHEPVRVTASAPVGLGRVVVRAVVLMLVHEVAVPVPPPAQSDIGSLAHGRQGTSRRAERRSVKSSGISASASAPPIADSAA